MTQAKPDLAKAYQKYWDYNNKSMSYRQQGNKEQADRYEKIAQRQFNHIHKLKNHQHANSTNS